MHWVVLWTLESYSEIIRHEPSEYKMHVQKSCLTPSWLQNQLNTFQVKSRSLQTEIGSSFPAII